MECARCRLPRFPVEIEEIKQIGFRVHACTNNKCVFDAVAREIA